MNCPSCNTKLTCGCQKRTAANGKQCCSQCITKCNQAAGNPLTSTKPYRPKPKGPYTPHT